MQNFLIVFVAAIVSCFLVPTYGNSILEINGSLGDDGDHNYEDCPFPALATFALCNIEVHDGAQWFKKVSRDIVCPTSTEVNTDEIQCIRAINLDNNSSDGGYARVLSGGGVGFDSVTVRLTSQVGKGLNFRVLVYTNKV